MKAAVLQGEPLVLSSGRLLDYLTLVRPRVSVLVLFTVAAGVLLAGGVSVSPALLLHAVLGVGLVAGGASALNQLLERRRDAHMRRTENRPLPAGRLLPVEVLVFGSLLGAGGVAYLALALPTPWAALLAALTLAAYVGVYTPLKPVTTLNTLVGAVPGAMPPVLGWVAVTGALTPGAWVLFTIVFLWQVPHFLAIAWIYREEYGRAGMCMLPVHDPTGTRTGRNMVLYSLALVPASLAPVLLGSAGPLYLAGAALLGTGYLGRSVGFRRRPGTAAARAVLRTSLVYLPALLALLVLDGALTWILAIR